MEHIAALLAGTVAAALVSSYVLRWIAGLIDLAKSRSGIAWTRKSAQFIAASVLNSGLWVVLFSIGATWYFATTSDEWWWASFALGFYGMLGLLTTLVLNVSHEGSSSLALRLGLALRQRRNYWRMCHWIAVLVCTSLIFSGAESKVPLGFVVFMGLVAIVGMYMGFWYMAQFVFPKPLTPAKRRDIDRAA